MWMLCWTDCWLFSSVNVCIWAYWQMWVLIGTRVWDVCVCVDVDGGGVRQGGDGEWRCRVSQEECVNWTDGVITSTNASAFNPVIVIIIVINMFFTSHMTNILPMSVDPLVSFCVWTPSRRILTSSSTSNASSAQKSAPQSEKEEIKKTQRKHLYMCIFTWRLRRKRTKKRRGVSLNRFMNMRLNGFSGGWRKCKGWWWRRKGCDKW